MKFLWPIAIFLLFIIGPPGKASSSLVFHSSVGKPPLVSANGQVVMHLPHRTAQEAAEIARRLNKSAQAGACAAQVSVKPSRHSAQLWVAGQLVLTVDRNMAKANHVSPMALAKVLQKNMMKVFSQTYVSIDANRRAVPVGEMREIILLGNPPPDLAATSDQSRLLTATIRGGRLVLTGLGPGLVNVTLSGPHIDLSIPIRVMRFACQVDTPLAARVTGGNVPAQVLEQAARHIFYQALRPEPSASLQVDCRASRPLPTNSKQSTIAVMLAADGPSLLPVRNQYPVTVTRVSFPVQEASLLMVSNSPERLAERGVWSEGSVEANSTVRLLYHHVNWSDFPARLAVELANNGSMPAVIRVVGVGAGPSQDEMYAGHTAAATFLEHRLQDIGYIIEIPPGVRYRPFQYLLPRGSLASGVTELRVISGPAVTIQIRLNSPDDKAIFLPIDGRRADPALRRWKFLEPKKMLKAKYVVGGNWTFISIGREPVKGIDGDSLLGNYGVVYQVELDLENPSDKEVWVDLLLATPSGPARAVAFVDGQKMETGFVPTTGESRLTAIRLSSGRQRTVQIETIPEAGSFYPVYLIARAREPGKGK